MREAPEIIGEGGKRKGSSGEWDGLRVGNVVYIRCGKTLVSIIKRDPL